MRLFKWGYEVDCWELQITVLSFMSASSLPGISTCTRNIVQASNKEKFSAMKERLTLGHKTVHNDMTLGNVEGQRLDCCFRF